MKYNKLIRDKVAEFIMAKGEKALTHVASPEEYWNKLKEKLEEEVKEFFESEDLEEIVDILEVLDAICEYKAFDKTTLSKKKEEKTQKKGRFEKRIIFGRILNMNKILTLCLISKDSQVLLGLKKRGFGVGKWNGFGGKLQVGETIEDAARREVLEESGLEVGNMEKRGIVHFEFEDNQEIMEVHIFGTEDFSGEVKESEEMAPRWFHKNGLPFEKMWPDDKYWMPLFLAGEKFAGRFLFNNSNEIINSQLSKRDNI